MVYVNHCHDALARNDREILPIVSWASKPRQIGITYKECVCVGPVYMYHYISGCGREVEPVHTYHTNSERVCALGLHICIIVSVFANEKQNQSTYHTKVSGYMRSSRVYVSLRYLLRTRTGALTCRHPSCSGHGSGCIGQKTCPWWDVTLSRWQGRLYQWLNRNIRSHE